MAGSHRQVSAPYVEVDPQAILISQHLAQELDVSMWHIIDAQREWTWCELFLTQGSELRPLSETPEDRRCETCIDRFGADVVRHPDT
jgi:hypothetical protein